LNKLLLIDLSDYSISADRDFKPLFIVSMPLGLMCLSAYLKKNLERKLDIRIVKAGIDFFTEADVERIIGDYDPGCIGIRTLSVHSAEFYSLCGKIKKWSGAVLISGGPHASSAPAETILEGGVDIIVIGEGEITLVELMRHLIDKTSYEDVAGIAFSTPDGARTTQPRELISNLDDLPLPDYEAIDFDKYADVVNWGSVRRRNVLIESSRGCLFGCIYCHNLFGLKIRFKSADHLLEEMRIIRGKYVVDEFFFVDDTFNFDYERAMLIFEGNIESGKVKLHFTNGLRGDLVDRRFIDKMADAGTVSVDYAVESASVRMQKYIGKHLNLDKVRESIEYTCEKGMIVRLFFMFGFPTETESEVEESLDYMQEFTKCLPMFHAVKYYKNTKLYNRALENGFSVEDIEKAGRGSYHDVKFCKTPLLSVLFMKKAFFRYLHEVLFNRKRITNMIELQKKHLSESEIRTFYSSFLMKDIESLDQLLAICK
jgi:anaerobic magnesium-protoporphyrin IX monomethyl ester cyclase